MLKIRSFELGFHFAVIPEKPDCGELAATVCQVLVETCSCGSRGMADKILRTTALYPITTSEHKFWHFYNRKRKEH